MEHKLRNKKKNRAAFTLGEFLAVIAIVSILASLSFVAVIHYQRKLRRLEMDQTAKEVFLAAQNHLTLEKSSGTFDRLINMSEEELLNDTENTSKLGIRIVNSGEEDSQNESSDSENSRSNYTQSSDNTKITYAILYSPDKSGINTTINTTEEIRGRLLPFGSIDETVREDGSYIILYEPETGLVREVWYSDSYEFVKDDIESEALKEASSDAGKRELFTGANSSLTDKKYPIGYYASGTLDEPDVIPEVELKAPKIKLVNDDILYVEVSDDNQTEHSLRLFVQGEKSQATGYIDVNKDATSRSKRVSKTSGNESDNAGTYIVILDDVTASDNNGNTSTGQNSESFGFKFVDFNLSNQTDMVIDKDERGFTESFIPGENIYVYAQVSSNHSLSSVEKSSTSSENSLFASVDTERGAIISSFRHLENLDERVSGFEPDKMFDGAINTNTDTDIDSNTVIAMQLKDLTWKSGTDSSDTNGFCGNVATLHKNFKNSALNQVASKISISYRLNTDVTNPDKTNVSYVEKATEAGSYLPIEPAFPVLYRGNTRVIYGLQVGETLAQAGSSSTDMVDRITGGKIGAVEGAGGLFGNVTSDLEVRDLLICEPLIHVNENAGALIGMVEPGSKSDGQSATSTYVSVKIKNVQVEYPNIIAEGNGESAGALIGSFEGKSLIIEKTVAENHFRKKLGSKELKNNGNDDLDEIAEAKYRIRSAKGTAGGLVGASLIYTNDAKLGIAGSVASVYVEGKNAGGLVGTVEKASNVNDSSTSASQYGQGTRVSIQNSYVGGHTKEAKYDENQIPGSGANTDSAYKAFCNLPGRYNIAAYQSGFSGGLAVKLPRDSAISCVYVSASVYSPDEVSAETNSTNSASDKDASGDVNSTVSSAAFIKQYDNNESGKLPSDVYKNADGTASQAIYPSCYVSGKVNEDYIINFSPELNDYFKASAPDTNDESVVNSDAYPYDPALKTGDTTGKQSGYPMPTVKDLARVNAGTDASKRKEAEKLSWFLQSHIGDWVKVVKKQDDDSDDEDDPGFKLYNGNRLYTEYISSKTVSELSDYAKKEYWYDSTEYIYFTYCITGETSQNSIYYTLRLKKNTSSEADCEYIRHENANTISSNGDWWYQVSTDDAHRFEVSQTSDGRLKIRFYLDNRTFQTSSFKQLDPYRNWQGNSIDQFTNGENITVKIAEPGQEIKDKDLKTATGNSLFESIEKLNKNDSSDNRYIAYIANSRHLLNLGVVNKNENVIDEKIVITQAVQTDNILWKEDTTVSAKTVPYCQEISSAYPSSGINVWYNYDGNGQGKNTTSEFVPIDNDKLISYDGQNHIISKLKVEQANWGGAALFKNTAKMSISNLSMKDTVIESSGQSAAILVANATKQSTYWYSGTDDSYLTISNVHIYGDETVLTGTMQTGAIIGNSGSSKITLNSILVEGTNLKITGGHPGTGGLIGNIEADELMIKNSYVNGQNLLISDNGGNGAAGGLVGSAKITTKMQMDNSYFSGYVRSGETSSYAGGLFGYLEINNSGGPNNPDGFIINNCYVAGRNHIYGEASDSTNSEDNKKTVTAPNYAGGIAGEAKGPLTVSNTFSNADVFAYGSNNPRAGGMFGSYNKNNSTGLKLSSCYITGNVYLSNGDNFVGKYVGQLNNTWWSDDNQSVDVTGSVAIDATCWYLSDSKVKLIGMPKVTYTAAETNGILKNIKKKNTAGLTNLTSELSDANAQEAITFDTALQNQPYPYPIWTIYSPNSNDTGKRLYVGDWISE